MTAFDRTELKVKNRKLIRDIRRQALALSVDSPNLAVAYYTPQGRAVAGLTLNSYSDDGQPRPTPDEVVPLLVDFGDAEVVGEPEVRHLNLPVGPALRIRATLRRRGGFLRLGRGRDRTTDILKYAVFPPGVKQVSVVEVTWHRPEDTDEATRLTDELASTVRMVLVDAEGNPREPDATE
ncbi:hypothetical protein STRCI_004707 [Streptomyces cinnabarinus]|uniref:Uncharacterized protein n=1 Tax=Streptomyces cinnabarinus TaxID=67287 RepID=A0ABY7KFT3_9ACTN|nr:hypothetical protein [Streptomyces cinnabarinus]WAZ23368.1 hypothetical protein STRCI_004707 [Streptomyces cinnabarinus]